ncbi:MAG TPA: HlyD family efflux transporter periplasmic adaptor subunit [Kofleriaceae bacterium]|nr:HlyD family efflux transporter periplasmic adaptor subunit [Kofleriaceae bacterium]
MIWAVVGLVGLGGLALAWLLSRSPLAVDASRVTRGVFERFVEEDGRARVRDRYLVSSPLAATVERTRFHVGDAVATGDEIAVLHPLPSSLLDARARAEFEQRAGAAEAALGRARTVLARSTATLEHANAELARARELLNKRAIPAVEAERAELEARVAARARDEAGFAVHVGEHELEVARSALGLATRARTAPERFAIASPISGRILRIVQESEGAVGPGTPLVEIGDPSALEVVVDVLSSDAVQIEPGDEASILRWGGPEAVAARVRLVEPVAHVKISALGVEEQRVDVVLDVMGRAPTWSRVGDGYRVDARILVERVPDALLVPTGALFREGGEWAAFVAIDGAAAKRAVRLRAYGPTQSAVESGLQDGDLVVEQPPEVLQPGMRLQVIGGDAARARPPVSADAGSARR